MSKHIATASRPSLMGDLLLCRMRKELRFSRNKSKQWTHVSIACYHRYLTPFVILHLVPRAPRCTSKRRYERADSRRPGSVLRNCVHAREKGQALKKHAKPHGPGFGQGRGVCREKSQTPTSNGVTSTYTLPAVRVNSGITYRGEPLRSPRIKRSSYTRLKKIQYYHKY